MRTSRLTAAGLLVLFLACDSTGPSADKWGGDHIMVDVQPDSARVTFECAYGAFPASALATGNFNVAGTWASAAGPLPPGGGLSYPAQYSGFVQGNRLTFTLTVADPVNLHATYTVYRGQQSQLVVCALADRGGTEGR